jgi:alkanesulfonate monooxygenase SsuD/methylene tetrahydromethanopterin reductase-like flavin-dependent oxidoreductase (luciferase family)
LVTSPNFRHPVPLAKDLLSIDDLSDGRLIVGVGSGGLGADASVLGGSECSARERTDRFVEFTRLLDELLQNDETSFDGTFYSALDARMLPGTVQRPRPPIFVAANGMRGIRLAAELGDGWITLGRSASGDESCFDVVRAQCARFDEILADEGRSSADCQRVLLNGLSEEHPLLSLDAFVDWAGRYQEIGFTELVIHWPEPHSIFEADMTVFELIAVDGLNQL